MFYLYLEGQAGKSPNEDSSFCSDYIITYLRSIQHLLFSDGCYGQNKSHYLLRLMNAFVSCEEFQRGEQYFPVMGHSFLPCDHDHDFVVVKRILRKCYREDTVNKYAELI